MNNNTRLKTLGGMQHARDAVLYIEGLKKQGVNVMVTRPDSMNKNNCPNCYGAGDYHVEYPIAGPSDSPFSISRKTTTESSAYGTPYERTSFRVDKSTGEGWYRLRVKPFKCFVCNGGGKNPNAQMGKLVEASELQLEMPEPFAAELPSYTGKSEQRKRQQRLQQLTVQANSMGGY